MPTTLPEIANKCLGLIGQTQILSLDDNTPEAKACKANIYQSAREVLSLGNWVCARKLSVLNRLRATPAFGWDYKYQLPGDYLAMVAFNDIDPANISEPLFEVIGAQIYTDQTTVSLTYVADLSANENDVGLLSPSLVELIALKMACNVVWYFQQSRTLRDSLLQEFEIRRKKALAANAREAKRPLVNRLNDSQWLRERRTSTNG